MSTQNKKSLVDQNDEKDEVKKESLKQLTIRVSPTVYDAITDISIQKSVSKSAVCRLAITGDLIKYLGTQTFIDIDDGKKIIQLLGKLLTMVGQIKLELQRIGVNYNQEVRLKHIQQKYKNNVIARKREEQEIENEINVVRTQDIQNLIDQQDQVITKAGKIACTLVFHQHEME